MIKEKALEIFNSFNELGLSASDSEKASIKCISHIIDGLTLFELGDSPYTTLHQRQFYVSVRIEINKIAKFVIKNGHYDESKINLS